MAAGGQPLADDDRVGAILVTSPSPAEGKTTIAVNLAAAFAETGRSVVVVNADFRRPLAAKILIDERPPLPAALDGIDRLDPSEFLVPTKLPGVQLLDLSPLGGTPGDLTRATVRLVTALADRVDVLVIDTPPLVVTTEALEFVPAAKVVVLVGRIGRTATAAAQRAGELARFGGAEQVAVALNDTGSMRLRRTTYYDYYGGRRGKGREQPAAAPPEPSTTPETSDGERSDDEWQEIDELVERADGAATAARRRRPVDQRALATGAMTSASAVYRLNRANVVAWLGLAAIAVYFAVLTHAVRAWPYDEWMVLLLAPALLAIGTGIIVAVTRHDDQPLTTLIVVALVVKLAASFARYYVAFSLYGSGDAKLYDQSGTEIAESFHRGELSLTDLLALRQGTGFIDDLTGLLYALTGPSRLGGFLVYSFIGFWGLFLFHRAARIGLPEGSQRRYALLVFFLPSLVFWPSSIGKEAVMMLSLGLCAYGAARILERQGWGWICLAARRRARLHGPAPRARRRARRARRRRGVPPASQPSTGPRSGGPHRDDRRADGGDGVRARPRDRPLPAELGGDEYDRGGRRAAGSCGIGNRRRWLADRPPDAQHAVGISGCRDVRALPPDDPRG